jgi:hypothetical protein
MQKNYKEIQKSEKSTPKGEQTRQKGLEMETYKEQELREMLWKV